MAAGQPRQVRRPSRDASLGGRTARSHRAAVLRSLGYPIQEDADEYHPGELLVSARAPGPHWRDPAVPPLAGSAGYFPGARERLLTGEFAGCVTTVVSGTYRSSAPGPPLHLCGSASSTRTAKANSTSHRRMSRQPRMTCMPACEAVPPCTPDLRGVRNCPTCGATVSMTRRPPAHAAASARPVRASSMRMRTGSTVTYHSGQRHSLRHRADRRPNPAA